MKWKELVNSKEVKVDRRFICDKCGSNDVKIKPMYGCVVTCQHCKHS